MENHIYLDQNAKTKGEQLINQQIMESYHSGVIDHDIRAISERKQEIE